MSFWIGFFLVDLALGLALFVLCFLYACVSTLVQWVKHRNDPPPAPQEPYTGPYYRV